MARPGVDDAVGADVLGDIGKACDHDGGNSIPFKLSGQRSPAARPGPSRGGQDNTHHPGGFNLLRPGAADLLHVFKTPAVAAGAQKIIVQA